MTRPEHRRTLIIFAKDPRPGQVKTRLAASIGSARAAEWYRRTAREIIDELRGGPWLTMIRFCPDAAGKAIRSWLGSDRLSFGPQGPGDLGDRMRRAVRSALAEGSEGHRVCVIGTDAPDVDGAVVEDAFALLEKDRDVVLGPAADGGYYLIGVDEDRPALFRDMPWSTAEVLQTTRDRIRTAGLEWAELPTLADVDDLADLESLRDRRSGSNPTTLK